MKPLITFLILLFMFPTAGNSAMLKSYVAVSSRLVTLGDFFEGAEKYTEIAVFQSPDPGKSGKVPAYRLMEIARNAGMLNIHDNGVVAITVERMSTEISIETVRELISGYLMDNGFIADLAMTDILIKNFDTILHADTSVIEPVRIRQFAHTPGRKRFSASISIDLGNKQYLHTIVGTIREMIDVVVLQRAMKPGEIIGPGDVALERRERSRVRNNHTSGIPDLIGQAARRHLSSGRVISSSDVSAPNIIRPNDIVVILYQVPGLTLTVRGRAVSAGAKNATINVLNLQSNRIIQAIAIQPGVVSVTKSISPIAQLGTN